MLYIKKTILVVLLLMPSILFAQEKAIKDAEKAYVEENYDMAIELYEGIIKSQGVASEIYYNLGNAYFKKNNLPAAILNYERALLLDPGDSDIKYNLMLAQQKTVDKIDKVDTFFLKNMYNWLCNFGAVDSWARLGIFSFLFFLLCAALYFFSSRTRFRKIGFFMGSFALLVVIFSNLFASTQRKELITHDTAIIFAPTITVKSSPDKSGTDLFVLHEGTKVKIKSTLGEWSEIILSNGNVGWLPTETYKKI